ncbi:MAG: hypothetical protein KC656_24965, partial [Myxococcales bacterium]|nr:hypothetical protein [Myxococcales bacterium]
MVHAITLRWMLGAVVVETLPVAVALVFGVSQIQAMVPSATMVAAFRDAPAPTAAGVRLLLAGLAALTGGRALREASGPVLPWLRTLPLADGRLALALAPGALLATLPFASFAFLRSPGAGLGTWVASAAAALLVAQGRWGHAGLTWAGASLGPVAFPAVALGLPLLGRSLRDARPGARRPRTARLGRGPVGALLARDLLGVVRLDGWSWVGWLAAAALFAAWLPGQLARSWDPASQAAGTVILVGALGPLPAWILGRAAVALGPALLHRTLPATPAQRLAALLALALLPL